MADVLGQLAAAWWIISALPRCIQRTFGYNPIWWWGPPTVAIALTVGAVVVAL